MPETKSFHVIEAVSVLEGAPVSGRRRWSARFKADLVAKTLEPGVNVSAIARSAGIQSWPRNIEQTDKWIFCLRAESSPGSSDQRAPALELVAAGNGGCRASRLTMHVNKVHHVTTIASVAEDFAVDEDWLADVASEMDIEDGCIWVYGVGDDGVQALTDDGIDYLRDLVRMRDDAPHWLKLPE